MSVGFDRRRTRGILSLASGARDPETSGFGFELTMRVAGDEDAPPQWPMQVLVHLAEYVFDTGNRFYPLHVGRLTGLPVRLPGDAAAALLFAEDPRLPPLSSANGRVELVQAFGITLDEEDLVARWDAAKLLDVVRRDNPLLVTDPQRASLLADPALGPELERMASHDGSARELELLPGLRVDHTPGMNTTLTLHLGRADAEIFARLLRTRIVHGQRARIETGELTLQLVPTAAGYAPWTSDDGTLIGIGVPPERACALADALATATGTLRWPWFAELVVERS